MESTCKYFGEILNDTIILMFIYDKAYYQGELFAVKILKDNNNNNMFTTYQKISSELAW